MYHYHKTACECGCWARKEGALASTTRLITKGMETGMKRWLCWCKKGKMEVHTF